MTQDEIIKMAKKSGFAHGIGCFAAVEEDIVAFAKLIIAKERNRLADELQKMPLNDTANSIAIWIRGQE